MVWVSGRELRRLLGGAKLAAPTYAGLAERLRLLIVDGQLGHGVRMASERDLAEVLSLSRSTVTATYAVLREGGYLRPRQGSGHFVHRPYAAVASALLPGTWDSRDGSISMTTAGESAAPGVAAAVEAATAQLPALLLGTGYLPDGLPQLRRRLADRFTDRGLPTGPDQIIVTAGALSALDIVVRTVTRPGSRVLVESPSYPNFLQALRRHRVRLVGYSLPPDGWETAGFARLIAASTPAMVMLIPDFQNPTGLRMSAAVRAGLAEPLRRSGAVTVIDETLVELDLDQPPVPVPPLASYLPGVLTIGSASKAFWGGLRIGWIRAPRSMLTALIDTRAVTDLGAAAFEQAVVAELLAAPASVLDGRRARLRRQRDHLQERLGRRLPDWTLNRPPGGLSLWAGLPRESSTELVAVARNRRLSLTAGPRFFVDGGGERSLRLPFTADLDVLTDAVDRLAAAWADLGTGVRAAPRAGPDALTA